MKVTDRTLRWWIGVLAAPVVLYCAVTIYASLLGPARPGWTGTPSQDKFTIHTIRPGSAADRAGLKPGDQVLSWDGLPVGRGRLGTWLLHAEKDRPYRLEVDRAGERRIVPLTLGARSLSEWADVNARAEFLILFGAVIYLGVGLVIALARPRDRAGWWGALFLVLNTVGAVDATRYLGGAGSFHTYSGLPSPVGMLFVVIIAITRGTIASVLLTFLATFPQKLFTSRWIWAAVWAPAVPSFLIVLYWTSRELFWPAAFPGAGLSQALADGGMMLSIAVAPLLCVVNYRRLVDLNQRRRMRIIVAGFAVSCAAVLSEMIPLSALSYQGGTLRELANAYLASPLSVLAAALYPAFAISMAYAILRHRLFDIRIIVRQGLQYAAARGLLLSLVPLVGAVFVLDLLFHGNQPLAGILAQRGWFYAVLAIGAYAAHKGQRTWLATLDRRFFRERYDAERVLRTVVDDIRQAGGFEQAALRVVSQIEAALHPEAAALLVRQPDEQAFTVLSTRPSGIRPIPVDSTLMGLLRLLNKPVEISQSEAGWLRQQLPPGETAFLREVRLEWIFPISLEPGKPEALLVVGPKRSEEPYSRSDLDLLEGVTSSLGLLLDRVPTTPGPRAAKAGSALVARRYRLDREIGRGGMGAVYEAFDTELERPVAVKLILADLTQSSAALTRFRREARAAAGFSHPNVVTVYDFGVAEDQRAYLVMELLPGCTLREELRRLGRLPVSRAIDILRGVCAAVEAAHERQILHRDLKPENIFLSGVGDRAVPKVLDFGVVKALSVGGETLSRPDTEPGALVGTMKYMAPEQLCGDAPSTSWDLWSLSVVAYEMLVGAYPFGGTDPSDWRTALLAGRVTPPREHLDSAPERWEALFARVLSSDRRSRPATAASLFADVRQAVQ